MAKLGIISLLAATSTIAFAQKASKPNIIVILADDMGYSDISSFGSEIQTPNLDRIAREGMKLTQFYNAGRSCPSRAALLSGMYHHKTGVGAMVKAMGNYPGYQGFLNDSCMTIAEAMKLGGYATYMSGKWHLGEKKGQWPCDRGFDRSYVFLGGATNFFYPNGTAFMPAKNNMALDNQFVDYKDGDYITDVFTDHAVRFIHENPREKPFFMYLAYTAPHWPLQAPEKTIQKYHGRYDKGWDHIRQERYQRMVQMGLIRPEWKLSARDETVPVWESLTEKEKQYWAKVMEIYAAMIDHMDQGIGRVLRELEQTKQLDNTLIMFMSDNGGCMEIADKFADPQKYTGPMGSGESFLAYEAKWANVSNVPFRFFKHWMHEGGISSPFIARYPKMIQAGSESNQMAHLIDVMATCLDLGQIQYPHSEKIKPLDGSSMTPLFKGKNQPIHEILMFEHLGFRALRQGNMKIVSVYPQNKWSLYNLDTDRSELNDLSSANPQMVKKMEQLYNEHAQKSEVIDWKIVSKSPKKRPKESNKRNDD